MGNRFLSVVAGAIIGTVLGYFFYSILGMFLAYGPLENSSLFVPDSARDALLVDSFLFGAIPGLLVGLLGGLVIPFYLPRGHMSKSIGALTWVITTTLVWVTQGGNLSLMNTGRIVMTIFVTFFLMVVALPISESISFVEKIRER